MVLQFKRLGFYKSRDTVELIQSIRKDVGLLFSPDEAYVIFSIAKAQSILEGDMAEVGVYRGSSAKLIYEAKGNRKLHFSIHLMDYIMYLMQIHILEIFDFGRKGNLAE